MDTRARDCIVESEPFAALWENDAVDDKTKQKVLVATLAVIGLGCGSYYFIFRDSGNEALRAQKSGPTVRKARAETADSGRAKRRTARTTKRREDAPTVRKQRDDSTRQTSTRRKARKGGKRRVEKKKVVPAA